MFNGRTGSSGSENSVRIFDPAVAIFLKEHIEFINFLNKKETSRLEILNGIEK
jgi:hypothetical protein